MPMETILEERCRTVVAPFVLSSRILDLLQQSGSSSVENLCYTQSNLIKLNYVWIVDTLSVYRGDEAKEVASPIFPAVGNNTAKWCLVANFEEFEDSFSLYLQLESCTKDAVEAIFEFTILNLNQENNRRGISRARRFKQGDTFGFKYVDWDELLDEENGYIIDDKLIILCEIKMVTDSINQCFPQISVSESRMSNDLGQLFTSQQLSDVTLAVEGKEFRAHKAILAARSPVFAAMFQHEMKEQKHNRVQIPDVTHDVMQQMLCFIYTDKAPNLHKMAVELLAAADKYCLDRLKEMCEENLCKSLSIENAADTLTLADMHSAKQLKTQAINFIIVNAKSVMKTRGWSTMVPSKPHLLAEAFQAFVDQYSEAF